jgi:hypothetical protein
LCLEFDGGEEAAIDHDNKVPLLLSAIVSWQLHPCTPMNSGIADASVHDQFSDQVPKAVEMSTACDSTPGSAVPIF